MRALLVLPLAGCLLEAPSGAEQSWPPPLGITIEAVVAGDLDGNGSSEVVVFSSGRDNQEGMYLLTGGKDLTGTTPRTFSRFVPYDFSTPPVAAHYVGGAAPRIFVADGESQIRLHAFANTLVEQDDIATTLTAGAATLWVRPILFPGGNQHLAVSNGSTIDHTRPDFSEIRPIPAPMMPTWNLAQTASSYPMGQDVVVYVATPAQIQRAVAPGPGGATMFVFAIVRQGRDWLGQTAVDLDGDGREEVVGFDLTSKELCVVEPYAAAIPVTPTCVQTNSMAPGNIVTIFAGVNLTMNPAPDLVIAQANANETRFTVLEDYSYSAGVLTATMIRPLMFAGGANTRALIVNGGPSTPNALIAFGTDGSFGCVMGPC